MDIRQLKMELDEMLHDVFGDSESTSIKLEEKSLFIGLYELRIYKNNGDFTVYHKGAERLKTDESIKVLWYIGEEIARIRIYAATVPG